MRKKLSKNLFSHIIGPMEFEHSIPYRWIRVKNSQVFEVFYFLMIFVFEAFFDAFSIALFVLTFGRKMVR